MARRIYAFGFALGLALTAGCGQPPTEATTTPELTPEQKESIKKATEGGGGPAMIQKMKKAGKTKPD